MEMSPLLDSAVIPIIKHGSFLLAVPLIIKSAITTIINRKEIAVFFIAYFLFLASHYAIEQYFNINYLYARLLIPFFLLLPFAIKNNDKKLLLLKTIFWSAIITLGIIFFMHMANGVDLYTHTNRDRFTAGFNHPGKFAMVCFCIFLLCVYLDTYKLLRIIIGIIMLTLIAISYTKNIMLVIAIGSFFYGFYKYRKPLLFLLTAGIITTIGVSYFSNIVYEKLNDITSARLSWWNTGVTLNFKADITYISLGTDQLISPIDEINPKERNLFHLDNSYLEVFLRDGLIGASLFLLSIFILFKNVSEQSKKIEFCKIALLLYFVFDSGFYSTGNLLFSVLWIICTAPQKHRELAIDTPR